MSSPRLNEQLYTLLMVVDQNHHGDRKAAGHVDIQANCFLCHSFPSPQLSVSFHPPKHSNGGKRCQKSTFFLSDSGLAARGEGDCGKAGRRGSDVVWPLASFRFSAPRTDGITKDYCATLGSSVCVFIVCLCACAVKLGVCVQACALGPMLRGEWT